MNKSSPSTADSSLSLFARVKNQDGDAWLQLVRWVGPFILRWCRDAGLQSADCDDVAGKVLEDGWRGLATFRREMPNYPFRAWVYALTKNHVNRLVPQRPEARSLPETEVAAGPGAAKALDWQRRAEHLLVRELAAQHANDPSFKAFYRTAVDGLPIAQVAQELGQAPWTVRQQRLAWIGRFRDRLRDQFGELLD